MSMTAPLAMSFTVPPAAALIAALTTVLNIAAVLITPNTAGPPTPIAPMPIVITVSINPLNAAKSSSFSICSAPFCIVASIALALLPAGSGNFLIKLPSFSIGTASPTRCKMPAARLFMIFSITSSSAGPTLAASFVTLPPSPRSCARLANTCPICSPVRAASSNRASSL